MPSNFNTAIVDSTGKTIFPSIGFTKNTKTTINRVAFGDGYEQRVVAGINYMPATWKLTWKDQSLTVIANIENFLKTQKGTDPFYWTPPGETTQYKVICPEGWDVEYSSPISRTLSTTFVQVFDPL
jgi:phage-related protein